MLKCGICLSYPIIKEINFYDTFFVNYACDCGGYEVALDKFIRLFKKENSKEGKHAQLFCKIHENQSNTKFCSNCVSFICLLCANNHQNHKVVDIQNVSGISDFVERRSNLTFAFESITKDILSMKKQVIKTLTEEIEKLQKDKENAIEYYNRNCKINNDLYFLIKTLLDNYDTCENKLYHLISLWSVGPFNLVKKSESFKEIIENEKKEISLAYSKYEFPGDVMESSNARFYRWNQELTKTPHELCQYFINKCKECFILLTNNSYLSILNYLRTQSLAVCGFFTFDESIYLELFDPFGGNGNKKINIIRAEPIDKHMVAIYSSYHDKVVIIDALKQSCKYEIETYEEEFHEYNLYQMKNPFMIKIRNGKCLFFNGRSLGVLELYKNDYSFILFPDVEEFIWTAAVLSNENYVIISEKSLMIFDRKYQKIFETEYQGCTSTFVFECGHGKLCIVDNVVLEFWNTETFEIEDKVGLNYTRPDVIKKISKNKFLHLQKPKEAV